MQCEYGEDKAMTDKNKDYSFDLKDKLTTKQLEDKGGIFYKIDKDDWCDLPISSYMRVKDNIWVRYID